MSLKSSQHVIVPCPFCDKPIQVFHRPQGIIAKQSRSLNFRPKHYEELYEAITDCPHCGKSKQELMLALAGKAAPKPKSKEELRKELEELGLSGRMSYKSGSVLGRKRRGRYTFRG